MLENKLTCPELMCRPIFKWGQRSLEAGRHLHFSVFFCSLKLCCPDVHISCSLSPPPATAGFLAGLVIGRHIKVGVSNVHWGSTWPRKASAVRREPADRPRDCRVYARCPINMASFFLKDGEDAAGAGTQGPSGADLLHPVQREAFAGDRGCQDSEHHWLPKDGLDLASRCPPASWP